MTMSPESVEIESRQQQSNNARIRSVSITTTPHTNKITNAEIRDVHSNSSDLPKVFSIQSDSDSDGDDNDPDPENNNAFPNTTGARTSPPSNHPGTANANANANATATATGKVISLSELKYGFSSYHAIFTPVSLTMILSALAVIYIQSSPSSRAANEQAVTGFYTVISMSDSDTTGNSNAKNFGIGLVNGLIMIAALTAATFLIVILYKYKCMKLLLGYMIFCSAMLLGVLGGVMFQTFLDAYDMGMDKITFYVLLVNFAAVGTIAIFYGKGIPTKVSQAYLVFTSVILAWQLSFFDELMAWILLVLLALYDLCAVLTPCGPLKALVNLMQRDDAPDMPGLLYEARLPEGVVRPGRGGGGTSTRNTTENVESSSGSGSGNGSDEHDNANNEVRNMNVNGNIRNGNTDVTRNTSTEAFGDNDSSTPIPATPTPTAPFSVQIAASASPSATPSSLAEPLTEVLPFAIAKIYKLPIHHSNCPQFVRDKYRPRTRTGTRSANGNGNVEADAEANSNPPPEYTPEELLTDVTVIFSPNGGRIDVQMPSVNVSSRPLWRRRDGSQLPRYIVKDFNGGVKRILVMNEDGRVFEERTGDRDREGGSSSSRSGDDGPQTIKLGLGDFIFYSVLVARAALNSFTTFAACMLVILAGLGGTLVLLSVYHAALPALPISIFLGVIFYFTTKVLIEPWVEIILTVPVYV